MSQTTMERPWTYERGCSKLEETNQPTEIWDGEIIMSPAPSFFHQVIVGCIEEALRHWVKTRRLGVVAGAPLDVVLAPDLTVQPDVIFISKARLGIVKQHINGAPDLTVEVVSPERRKRDYKLKKERYEQYGVREYWIVDPQEKRIEIWWLNEEGFYELFGRFTSKQSAASKLLPGFKLSLDQVFGDPLKV
jgi:Uma2 family endonuclease